MGSDVEQKEFDAWTGDQISNVDDVGKLQRAIDYFRQEGIFTTSKAVEERLAQLVGRRGPSQPSSRDVAEAISILSSFQEECRQKESLKQANSRSKTGIAQLQPPVRSTGKCDSKAPAPVATPASKGSKGNKAVPRSQDLTDQSLQQEEQPPLGGAPLKISSGSMPGAARAHQQGQGKGLVQEVRLRGAQRTQELVKQNQHLPIADKVAQAEAERAKGNEHFRSGHTAEAVECYTLCIALDPTQLAAYTNRAQAYLRLQQWDDAITDCNSALAILQQQEAAGGSPQQALRIKALIRRGRAHEGKKQHQHALRDYENLLELVPEDLEIQELAVKARKALGLPAAAAAPKPEGRRIQVVKVSGEEEDEEEDSAASAPADSKQEQKQQQRQQSSAQASTKHQQQQQSPRVSPLVSPSQQAAGRHPIMVIEEDSDESDFEDSDAQRQQQQQQQQPMPSQQAAASVAGVRAAEHPAAPVEAAASQPAAAAIAPQPPTPQPAAPVEVLAAAAQPAEGLRAGNSSSNSSNSSTGTPAAVPAQTHGTNAQWAEQPVDYSSSGSSGGAGSSGSSSDDEASEDSSDGSSDTEGDSSVEPVLLTFDQMLDNICEEGKAAYQKGNFRGALNAYSRALQHAPDSARVLVNAALMLLKLSQPDDAHEKATLALGLQPRNAKAYHARHKAKEALGDFKGSIADLETVLTLEPASRQAKVVEELASLRARAKALTLQGHRAAAQARQTSRTVAASCTIEEVADDPEEEHERLHDQLKAQELMLLNRARKLPDKASALRAKYEAQRAAQQEARQRVLLAKQQRAYSRQQREQRRQALAQQRNSVWAQKKQERQQRLAHAAQGLASPAASPAATQETTAADEHVSGRVAAPAGPPTPPASHRHAEAAPGETPSPKAEQGAAAADEAVPIADPRLTAATPATAGSDEPVEGATSPSTPPGDFKAAPTPNSTPAGPMFVFSSPGGTKSQQQAKGLSPAGKARQQQQAHRSEPLTAAAVRATIARQIEDFRQLGNNLQMAGDMDGAEAAYMEALDLQPNHVKVLLNLAALALHKGDGKRALQCCEEVLEQQGTAPELTQTLIQKAMLRRGLAYELLGDYARALTDLSTVKEQQGAATDPRLAQDLLRVAQLVQQQKQQLAAAADPAACAAAKRLPVAVAPASSDSGSDGGSSSTASDSERTVTDEDGPQQQGRHRSGVKVSDLTWDPTQPYGADVDLNGVDPEALQALQMLRQQSQSGPSSSDGASDHGEGLQGLADLLGESAMIDDTWKDWDPTQDEDGRAATAVDTYSRLVSQSPLLQEFEQQQQQQQQQHVQSKTSRGKGRQEQSKQRVEELAAAGGDPQQMLKRIHKLIAAQQQQELAEQVQKSAEREKGNAAFKDGNWQGALKHYSAALEANPQDVRAFSNRAQLYLKMKRYAKSEEDCSKALQLLQGLSSAQQAAAQLDVDAVAAATLHSKVLYRRAVARKEQGMFKEALADLKTLRESSGATSDPSVDRLYVEAAEAFKQQLQRVVQASKQQSQPDAAEGMSPTPAVEGTAATPVVRLHRIVIEETDRSDSEDVSDHAADAEGRDVGSSSDNADVLPSVLRATAPAKPQPAAAAVSVRAASGSTQRAADQQAQEVKPPAAAAAAASKAPAQARVLSAPKTATEFLTTAKSLLAPAAATATAAAVKGRSVPGAVQAQQQERLAAYIRLLDPSQYAGVFKAGFDAQAMPLLLQGLAKISLTDLDFAERGLAALAKVDRFAIVYPMLGKAKGLAAQIVGQLQSVGRDVEGLKSSYRL